MASKRGADGCTMYKMTTNSKHNYPVAPNLLDRQFIAEHPNQKWLTDITYVPTREGWLYLAAVLDVYSRKVVGWAMDKHMEQGLVACALHCRWPPLIADRPADCCTTQTEAVSMPHTITSGCSLHTP